MGNSTSCSGGLLDCNVAGAATIANQEQEAEEEYLLEDEYTEYHEHQKKLRHRDSVHEASNSKKELLLSQSKAGVSDSEDANDATVASTITNAGPWMEDGFPDRSMMDPLPLASEFDTRPSTRDMILQHSAAIQQVQQELKSHPLYIPARHDELWIMRYLLSQKTVAKAANCAKRFMEYRAARQLDELDIRAFPPSMTCPQNAGVRKYFECLEEDAMTFSLPDPDRGIVILAKLSGFHQRKLMEAIPDDAADETTVENTETTEWPFWYFMEWSFQVLDSITRRTGRLTKGVRLVDLQGYSLHQNDRSHVQRSTDNAKQVQDQYPQMLASVFLVNAPSWMGMAFRLFRPLLPKRFVEKFDILPKHQTKRLLAHLRMEHIPTKFGGTFEEWPYPNKIIDNSHIASNGLELEPQPSVEESLSEEVEFKMANEPPKQSKRDELDGSIKSTTSDKSSKSSSSRLKATVATGSIMKKLKRLRRRSATAVSDTEEREIPPVRRNSLTLPAAGSTRSVEV